MLAWGWHNERGQFYVEEDIMWISNNWSSGGIGLGYGHALNWNDKESFGTLVFLF